jgi:hypothetical protein
MLRKCSWREFEHDENKKTVTRSHQKTRKGCCMAPKHISDSRDDAHYRHTAAWMHASRDDAHYRHTAAWMHASSHAFVCSIYTVSRCSIAATTTTAGRSPGLTTCVVMNERHHYYGSSEMVEESLQYYVGCQLILLETRAQLCHAFPSDWASGNKNIGVVMRN